MSEVLSLLGETLLQPDGTEVKTAAAVGSKSVLALYFSAHWCPPCRGFTPTLCEKYTALKDAGKDFELVFVSSDKDEAACKEYHSSMNFLGLPFALRDAKAKLSKMFKVSGIPTLVFYDLAEDKIITTSGRDEVTNGAFVANFPYKPEPFSKALLGTSLRQPKGEMVQASEVLDVDVIALYFSAHWCPPCRGFTPTLCEKYTALKAAGKSMELVFVSSDRDEAAFADYADSMTFPAMAYADRAGKEKLSKLFKVQGIPSLVFVDARTGELINGSGRGAISAASFVADFPYHPKPVYDLSEALDGINDETSVLVLMEQVPKEQQQELTCMLLAFANEQKKNPDAIASRFFTACGGGPVEQVRKMCGAGDAADTPTMLLLNFEDEGAHYHPLDEHKVVSKANLQSFLQAFKAGKLTKRSPTS